MQKMAIKKFLKRRLAAQKKRGGTGKGIEKNNSLFNDVTQALLFFKVINDFCTAVTDKKILKQTKLKSIKFHDKDSP